MSLHFAIAIKLDAKIGYLPVPNLLEKKSDESFYCQKQIIHKGDIAGYDFLQNDWVKTIVDLCNDLDYISLNKKFNKNHHKTNFVEYLANADKMKLGLIHKTIDKSKTKIINIVIENKPLLYVFIDRWSNVHAGNFISYPENHATVKFGFEKKEKTLHYKLKLFYNEAEIKTKGSGIIVLTNNEPYIIFDGKLIGFGDNTSFNGNKIKPFLVKDEIVVENRLQGIFFEKFVRGAVKEFEFDIKGFELVEVPVKIRPVLEISESIFGKIVISPIFYYGNKKVFFYTKQKVFVDVAKKGGDYYLESTHRDLAYELSMTSGLIEIGLIENDKYYTYLPEIIDKHLFTEKFGKVFIRIKRLGFKVDNKLFPREVNYSVPKLKIASNKGHKAIFQKHDWFDMYITVKFGVHEIEFYKLKNHILNKEREIELPDSSIAVIPEAWFAELNFFAKCVKPNNETSIQRANYEMLLNCKIVSPEVGIVKDAIAFDNQKEVQMPKGSVAIFRDYQKAGFQWIHNTTQNRFGVCLADEMGLGKTLQVITVLQKFYEDKNVQNPLMHDANTQLSLFGDPVAGTLSENTSFLSSLIVMPRSLIYNWIEELKKFAPGLTYMVYHGADRNIILNKSLHKKHLIITTYGMVRQDVESLRDIGFGYLVLDESQAIKNPGSKIYKSIVQLESEHKISMTGTPFENNLTDLWSQMNFLNSGMLGNLAYFKTDYIDKIMGDSKAPEIEDLKKLISPFILRRLKKDVAKELPEKTEQIIYCKMGKPQQELYETEKSAVRNELLFVKKKKNFLIVLSVLNKLRQITLHPLLVDKSSKIESAKYDTIVPFIENLLAQGDKFLIFSSFVKHLDIYKKYFEDNNIDYSMLTGKDSDRKKIVDGFQNSDQIKPFLISIKAGGVGLNITSANYVLIIDPWWNPFVEQQAIDRTHRIGQTKNVFIYRFIVKDTVEEKIIKLQKKKIEMSTELFDKASFEKIKLEDIEGLVGI